MLTAKYCLKTKPFKISIFLVQIGYSTLATTSFQTYCTSFSGFRAATYNQPKEQNVSIIYVDFFTDGKGFIIMSAPLLLPTVPTAYETQL